MATSEELQTAINYKNYFEIKMQNDDLNYNKFFTIGKNSKSMKDFTSENASKMNFKEFHSLINKEVKKIKKNN